MLHIGCHLSSSKGFLHMGEEALSINADTFQFFSRNPRGSSVKAIDNEDVLALRNLMEQYHFPVILAHAPYTLNPCSKEERIRRFAQKIMKDDLQRMEFLPGNLYNFHPGSHVGQGSGIGIQQITELLNCLITPQQTTTILLETMAGKGSEVGSHFEELQKIIEGVEHKEKMGVCLDTCHVYDAGYDIVNNLDGVLKEFDQTIGLNHLCAVHLNDSKNPFGSHKDRHEKIGEGSIGFEAMVRIINHPALRHLPFFLETPNELPGYQKEIARLREAYIED